MTIKPILGSITAMVTPFTAGGSDIDEPALRALVDRLVDDGNHGLLPCGGTGEFASMTIEERRRVLEIVTDQNAGRAAVLAHTGALFTDEAIRLSVHAQEHGADALMVSTPFYEALGLDEAAAYYAAVAAAVDVPVCLYNYPNATGINLDPEFVTTLATEIEGVKYVKDSAADLGQYITLITDCADKVTALNGEDVLLGPALTLGAPGFVVGTSNFIGPGLSKMFAASTAGDDATLLSIWRAVTPVLQVAASMPYAAAVKAACNYLGHPVGDVRSPGRALTTDEHARLVKAIDALDSSLLTTPAR
ncbi:dihydrodipicolinate synthase family protein [Rhodococcoides kyotonense]|uniref:4-hydroxy-tetrahydrodipicolinate synthase n=1 Tax=Rhodococcoides kyotonense TaxID=398843 RepID=A0A239N718_9NOCA|nr:dihydrodipicolinate synthase family protein [Rhodococcus kyotonensis]SNT50721.1 4-hydroxy-tetrahydrodipicolinate synthase [Rhodococcus kyotonensis]